MFIVVLDDIIMTTSCEFPKIDQQINNFNVACYHSIVLKQNSD